MKLSELEEKPIDVNTNLVTTVDGGGVTPISNIAAIAASASGGSHTPCWTGTITIAKNGGAAIPIGGHGYLKVISSKTLKSAYGAFVNVFGIPYGAPTNSTNPYVFVTYNYGKLANTNGMIIPLPFHFNVSFSTNISTSADHMGAPPADPIPGTTTPCIDAVTNTNVLKDNSVGELLGETLTVEAYMIGL